VLVLVLVLVLERLKRFCPKWKPVPISKFSYVHAADSENAFRIEHEHGKSKGVKGDKISVFVTFVIFCELLCFFWLPDRTGFGESAGWNGRGAGFFFLAVGQVKRESGED